MGWGNKFPDLKNDPRYLEPRVTAAETSLAQKVQQGELVINVQNYTCTDGQKVKGDGNHDDTTGIQSALDDAFTKKAIVYFPSGKYLMTASLKVHPQQRIIGSNFYQTNSTDVSTLECVLIANAPSVFIPYTSGQATAITVRDMAIVSGVVYNNPSSGTPTGTVFANLAMAYADISHNFIKGFSIVINDGLGGLCKIENNNFLSIGQSIITNGNVVDCSIKGNYCNMVGGNGNQIAFNIGSLSTTLFLDNFIDFAYQAIVARAVQASKIIGNIIDYSIQGLNVRGVQNMDISHNSFHHMTKTYASQAHPNLASASTINWTGVILYNSIDSVSLMGNIATEGDLLIDMSVEAYTNVFTQGNKIKGKTAKDIFKLGYGKSTWFANDGVDILLSELNYQSYTTYPSPAITGGGITTFNGQLVVYNGKVLRNDNGTWKDMSGTVVAS